MVAFITQIFLLCYFGQQVITGSQRLLYQSNWPTFIAVKSSRNSVLILERMLQQDVVIVIGELMSLSLIAFASLYIINHRLRVCQYLG